jgi:hypothetical protein
MSLAALVMFCAAKTFFGKLYLRHPFNEFEVQNQYQNAHSMFPSANESSL